MLSSLSHVSIGGSKPILNAAYDMIYDIKNWLHAHGQYYHWIWGVGHGAYLQKTGLKRILVSIINPFIDSCSQQLKDILIDHSSLEPSILLHQRNNDFLGTKKPVEYECGLIPWASGDCHLWKSITSDLRGFNPPPLISKSWLWAWLLRYSGRLRRRIAADQLAFIDTVM